MRRIYESSALRRSDEPFAPNEENTSDRPQAMRSVPGGLLSGLFLPTRLRYRAVSVRVETPDRAFAPGSPVPFRVTMRNALPVPVTVPVESPVRWTWAVDGVPEASHVPLHGPPTERHGFRFERGECKRFDREWPGSFRIAEAEWEPAEPGDHTIGVTINVDDPEATGLHDETTVRLASD